MNCRCTEYHRLHGEVCEVCTLKARIAELEEEAKVVDQALTDACDERDEYAARCEALAKKLEWHGCQYDGSSHDALGWGKWSTLQVRKV